MNKIIDRRVLPENDSKKEEGEDAKARADAIHSFKSRSATAAPYSSLLARYDLTAKAATEEVK